jgi:UbiD family decarboxylase
VLKFPVPFLHELDGGRYIGTDDLVIMRDPEGNWVNCGTYRVMVHDAKRVGVWMSPGKHGRQIREKYFKQGKPCPVLVSCGHDPMLFLAGGNELRFGLSEYDYAGGHRGLPFDVIESPLHGLPMPAHAEIVLEGEMHPGETAPEGPFGEFTGYYAGGQSEQPVIRVQRVYHRNDPILTVATPMRPPSDFSYSKCVMKAGMIWDEVERAGVSGVKGVWCHEAGGARMFNVIAIKQAYAGHSKQGAMAAASCQSGSYLGRFVVVVDEDIDPTDLFEVLWAMCTRCDPAEDIDIIRKMWSGPLDPRIPRGTTWNSRAVIDACRPFEMLADFPPVARATPELRAKVEAKFREILSKL